MVLRSGPIDSVMNTDEGFEAFLTGIEEDFEMSGAVERVVIYSNGGVDYRDTLWRDSDGVHREIVIIGNDNKGNETVETVVVK